MENGDWAHMVNINGNNIDGVDIVYCANKNRIMFKTRKIYLTRKNILRKAICLGWLLDGC